MPDPKTISIAGDLLARHSESPEPSLALVIAWCATEAQRVGEVAFFPDGAPLRTLGRGEGEDDAPRVRFYRQRPGRLSPTEPLTSASLSRRQLTAQARGGELAIACAGRGPLLVNGVEATEASLAPGDTLLVRGQLLLFCTRRAASMPKTAQLAEAAFGAFGAADALGILGESPPIWAAREQIAFAAGADKHVLVRGESGSGKELVARALHALSARAKGPYVSRNAATLPPALIDAELFGNAKNYPNPGMAERRGLFGEADSGTLFLDEIAELSVEQQSHLLRALDAGGEYQRLGDATIRRADVRLIGATNREAGALRADLAARFPLVIHLPPLGARREDIPLLVRHLILRAARESPRIAARFVVEGEPRVDPALVTELLGRTYATNVRELEAVLWRAMAGSPGDTVVLPDDLRGKDRGALGGEMNGERIRAALAAAGGSVERAARALGLPSRYALYRLMKKHAIEPVDPPTPGDD